MDIRYIGLGNIITIIILCVIVKLKLSEGQFYFTITQTYLIYTVIIINIISYITLLSSVAYKYDNFDLNGSIVANNIHINLMIGLFNFALAFILQN